MNSLDYYSYRLIGKLTAFLVYARRVDKRAAFLTQLKAKVGSSLAKAAAMRVNLNIDGTPITSRSHTHPSHSQTSRLLTSSLSLGVPVPLTMEWM